MGLLDDREEGALGPPPWLEERREARAVADPGIARFKVPTRVSQRRSRYPFRDVSRRSGSRSPWGMPVSSITSASVTAAASTRTPFRRKSTSPSAIALRSVSSTAILSSAIVVFLRVVGCKSNDARMTRWPLSFRAVRRYTKSGHTTLIRRAIWSSTAAGLETRWRSRIGQVSSLPSRFR